MKVFELVKALVKFDPNMEVTITDGLPLDGIERSYRGDFDLNRFTDEHTGIRTVDIGIGDCLEYTRDQRTGRYLYRADGFDGGAIDMNEVVARLMDYPQTRDAMFHWLREFQCGGSQERFLERYIYRASHPRNPVDLAVDLLHEFEADPNFDRQEFRNLVDEIMSTP
jgi:hypothetical protein